MSLHLTYNVKEPNRMVVKTKLPPAIATGEYLSDLSGGRPKRRFSAAPRLGGRHLGGSMDSVKQKNDYNAASPDFFSPR
jgi:hypothetical protein